MGIMNYMWRNMNLFCEQVVNVYAKSTVSSDYHTINEMVQKAIRKVSGKEFAGYGFDLNVDFPINDCDSVYRIVSTVHPLNELNYKKYHYLMSVRAGNKEVHYHIKNNADVNRFLRSFRESLRGYVEFYKRDYSKRSFTLSYFSVYRTWVSSIPESDFPYINKLFPTLYANVCDIALKSVKLPSGVSFSKNEVGVRDGLALLFRETLKDSLYAESLDFGDSLKYSVPYSLLVSVKLLVKLLDYYIKLSDYENWSFEMNGNSVGFSGIKSEGTYFEKKYNLLTEICDIYLSSLRKREYIDEVVIKNTKNGMIYTLK